ncbi:hypothetical protein I314_06678 [Cryptococcus bacillisporus CA1873]|uniref:CASP-like protein n=1 Tax=Cryptococcus bacillisporus CA1873 TaxID=1296111 RepID=A0ABR5B1R9_CRYGA|nr:hypothetical protein I314_06678 [Cryptococcus bacillisporus CA1873]|eukprot:KIR57539.1 hypothetical protein I314_06678 [Cryptococcus gattii CA1873]
MWCAAHEPSPSPEHSTPVGNQSGPAGGAVHPPALPPSMGVSPPPSSDQDGRLPLTTAWTSTKQWAILLVVDFLLAAVSSALCLPAITDFKPVSM